MATLTEQKKLILPYLQRADEIQTLSPKVAYYLRLYAIEQGLQIPDRAPEIQGVLEALMEKLEQDKPGVQLDAEEDAQVCEAFAVTVFNRADKQDRAGKADANTVKAYYVATIFIDMLNHFGELPPDMAERQRYAAWKAADIRKALREGRVPDPGPPVKADDLGLDLPDIPGSGPLPPPPQASGSAPPPPLPSGDLDLPAIPGPSSSSQAQQQLGAPRFRPGSKVWFNAPGGAPERGTVVNISRTPAGWACRVGLRQSVTEAPEAALAHDFAPGEAVLFRPKAAPGSPATVAKVDAASWPIAYLLTLPDGSSVPTTEASLTPAAAAPEQPAAPPPPQQQSAAGPGSSAGVSPAASGSLPPPPTVAPEPSADGYESDADESEAAGPPPLPLDSLSLHAPDAPEAFARASPPPPAPAGSFPGSSPPRGGFAGVSPGGPPAAEPPAGPCPGVRHGSQAPPPQAGDGAGAYPAIGHAGGPLPGPHAAPAPPGPAPSTAARPAAATAAAAAAAAAAPLPAPAPGFQPSVQQLQEAHKLTKYALSSLSFEDVPTAVANLRKALGVLEGRGGGR